MVSLLFFCYRYSLSVFIATFRHFEDFLDLLSSCFCLSLNFCIITWSRGLGQGSCIKYSSLPSSCPRWHQPVPVVCCTAPLFFLDVKEDLSPVLSVLYVCVTSEGGSSNVFCNCFNNLFKEVQQSPGGKKKLLIVCDVKFLKHKTRTRFCFELKCSVQRVCSICQGKMLYFAGTKGCTF